MILLALLVAAAPAPSTALTPGRYALVMRFTTEADAPIVGKVRTETVSTALVDVARRDGRTWATQRACGFVTDGGLFTTRAGPAFLHAMKVAHYELVQDGDRVRGDMGIAAVGVDPRVRALPKDGNDAAYTDPDGDGKKGAPLEVDVGALKLKLDVASLGRAVLVGTVKDGRVEGKTEVAFSQERILGGLPAFVAGDGKKRIAQSSFTMTPLSGGGTCRDVEHVDDVALHAPSAASVRSTSRT